MVQAMAAYSIQCKAHNSIHLQRNRCSSHTAAHQTGWFKYEIIASFTASPLKHLSCMIKPISKELFLKETELKDHCEDKLAMHKIKQNALVIVGLVYLKTWDKAMR